jgi:DNA-binding transcriptional MerR regulator
METRVKKYAELRDSIAKDEEGIVYHKTLAPYASRLSNVDERFNIETQDDSHVPLHSKTLISKGDYKSLETDMDVDLIDKFINEVKAYNIKSGQANDFDTGKNIISSLQKSSEKLINPTSVEEIKEILLHDDEDSSQENVGELRDILLEKTQEINTSLLTFEKSIHDVNTQLNSTNKIVNALLTLFLLGLVGIIFSALYWLINSRGFLQ